jgi:GTP-sensing pleiotropic transcriptional regulator CodY
LEPALLYSFRKRAGVHYEAAKLMLEREGPESRVFDVLERDGGGLTARQLNQKIRGMEGQEVTDALTGLEAAGRIQSRVQGRAVLWAVASA